jgi:glycosyltransferase involved in cell wall biosynthesis
MDIFPRGTDPETFSPDWREDDFFCRFGGRPDTLKLLYVGRVSREKDLDVLAEAFLELRERRGDTELFIVGDGPYVQELMDAVGGSGGFFCGMLSGENLSKAYASADIFVFPSTTDTYGNSVLEAQSSGLPAVVTDMGGPQEIIRPERSGLVYPGRDAEALVESLCTLLDEPGLRERMGREGRGMALSRTWSEAFETVWENALPGTGEWTG